MTDLADLSQPGDLGTINLVRKKTKEYEFHELMKIKETQNGSKMRKLKYEKLELQECLKTLEVAWVITCF